MYQMASKVTFFVVGFPKSGSTTLYNSLRAHPEIFSSAVKEVNFFNSDRNRHVQERLGKHYFQLVSSLEEYSRLFDDSEGRLKGDFTPVNIFSEEAPQNIYDYNPDAKILISIREPISFLRSFHFQSVYNLSEDQPDFIRALALEPSRRFGENIPKYCYDPFYLIYSDLADYRKYIRNFVGTFDPSKIMILLFDDIVAGEARLYREILSFLGVRNMNFAPQAIDTNPSHALRFRPLREAMLHPAVNKFLYQVTPRSFLAIAGRLSQRLFKSPEDKPAVPLSEIARLRQQFKPQVVELETFLKQSGLLQRNLASLWGYD
jgi:hypothetical protein